MQVHHRPRGRAGLIKRHVQRQFLGGRVASHMPAFDIEAGEPLRLQKAKA
jgi:hypothetical protein